MSVRKCKREVSHREYLSWIEWFQLEQNTPSRADHYAMQITQAIKSHHYSQYKNPPPVPALDKLAIPFVWKEQKEKKKPVKLTREEATKRSQALWCGRLGITRKSSNG